MKILLSGCLSLKYSYLFHFIYENVSRKAIHAETNLNLGRKISQ